MKEEEEEEDIELDIEAKYVNKTEKEFLSNITYAECIYILTPENKYCDKIRELSVLKLCEIIDRLQKENEELKEDRKNNNEMIALAQNEILNYMSGYEDGKKHKMTAVAQVVENQQYYIVRKQMEKYEEHIKRLQKENEELKNQEATQRKINELLVQRYSNSISVQTVKDKIEEYKNMLKTCNKVKDIDRIKAINERILELEELLEGRKENGTSNERTNTL